MWLPYWPMETWERARNRGKRQRFCRSRTGAPSDPETEKEPPLALIVSTPRGELIHDTDALGRSLGLAAGQRVMDAMAIHRDLRVTWADPRFEARALGRLASWSRRWTPRTRTDGPDGIALDVTGCIHLFGGEETMLQDMRERLQRLGVTAFVACAPNHAASHALARHVCTELDVASVGLEALEAAVAPLPVSALRIDPASIQLLKRLGLKTIGQLTALPRASLKKRFDSKRKNRDPRDDTFDDYLGRATGTSADVLTRLDEILGRAKTPFDAERSAMPPRIMHGLAEPVLETTAILACAAPLIEELAALLETRGEGARIIRLEGFRTDGGRSQTVLRLSCPTRDPHHVMRLLIDRLDDWRAEFGFDAFAVEAVETESLDPMQRNGLEKERKADLAGLVDRLSNRLGENRVLRAVPTDSHLPERARSWISARRTFARGTPMIVTASDEISFHAHPTPRPTRLFDNPEEIGVVHTVPEGPPARFVWRHMPYDVALVAGPERIAPEWWREKHHVRARDYYRVETSEGRRFWIFREGFENDERGGTPRWFMHGLFS